MTEPLDAALDRVRADLLDPERLVRAVAPRRCRGGTPRWRRAELRYVHLKAGRRLQVTTYDATQAFTANHDAAAAPAAVAALLDDPERRARMGAAGRRRVLEHFSWRAVAVATAQAYEQARLAHVPADGDDVAHR